MLKLRIEANGTLLAHAFEIGNVYGPLIGLFIKQRKHLKEKLGRQIAHENEVLDGYGAISPYKDEFDKSQD